MNKAQDSDTPRVNAVVKAGEYLTNTSALSELAMLARTLERELAAEREARIEAEADAQSWADQNDDRVKDVITVLERAERAEAKLRELENSLYLSRGAHDIAEKELAAMNEAK